MSVEYEHSFKVKNIEDVFKFCDSNGYKKVFESKQNRIVFENEYNRNVIARLTTTIKDDETNTILDFKNINTKQGNLNISDESLPLIVNDENKQIILSMLNTMNFQQSADNLRVRTVYEKDSVKFEIDNYIHPVMNVVAIEGEKSEVENVYKQIEYLIKK